MCESMYNQIKIEEKDCNFHGILYCWFAHPDKNTVKVSVTFAVNQK